MTATIAERVAAGAAFLDEHDPGWWQEDVDRAIDLGTLDLSWPDGCILGQRCPLDILQKSRHASPYSAYASKLSRARNLDRLWDWAAPLGFVSPDWYAYPDLTAAWRALIEARRAAP